MGGVGVRISEAISWWGRGIDNVGVDAFVLA